MATKLTAEDVAALRPLAEALRDTQSADDVFDALLEGLDAARERRKERLAAQREQDAAERKARQMEYWRNCQRDHERPDMCGPECATPSDRREQYTRIVESPGASDRKVSRLGR